MIEEEPLSMKSDETLARMFQEGQTRAFDALMARHKEKMMKYAYLMVGNYEDAKEIAQDAFVKAYQHLGKFEGKSKFVTWFYRILINTSRDYLRKRKWAFMTWKKNEDMEAYWEQVGDPRASTDRGAVSDETNRQITKAVQELPEKQRWIFTLRFIEGMSLSEIAEAVGSSEGTVKASIHFAVQKFKDKLLPLMKGDC